MKDTLRRARRIVRSVVGTDVYVRRQVKRPTELVGGRQGSGFGGWVVDPQPLSEASVVYSAGIGDDVSFDLALIDRFGFTVHAFDPTPESHRWLATQTLPEEFVAHEFGLASHDGVIPFFAHENEEWIAHSTIKSAHTVPTGVELPVRRLTTVMEQLGHERIDLLKVDIEGAEYEVIDDLVAAGVPCGSSSWSSTIASKGSRRSRRAARSTGSTITASASSVSPRTGTTTRSFACDGAFEVDALAPVTERRGADRVHAVADPVQLHELATRRWLAVLLAHRVARG